MNPKKLKKQLENIVTEDRVVASRNIPTKYRFDALRPYRPFPKLRSRGYLPTILVRPETSEEVVEIVRLAAKSRTPLVPYGGGTGLMGAAIAVHGGIMIDTCGMSKIEDVSEENMIVRAEPGVVLEDVYNKLHEHGLLFAHDPWTRPVATLGGAISTNSLGYMGAKYGSIGDQLLGLEAVMPNGRLLKTRPAQFSSTGFDLNGLFLGTEGAFGVVTSAVVRAFPEPERFAVASYTFPSFERGYRAILTMRTRGVRPIMIDYGEETPGRGSEAILNLAFDGLEGEVEAHVRGAESIAHQYSGLKPSEGAAREFWDHRHDIALMYKERISKELPEEEPRTKYDYLDISLPTTRVLDFRDDVLRNAKSCGVNVLEVGLWHGPELLSLVLSARAATPRDATRKLWRASDVILRHAQDIGGSMEFCHGVGLRLAHLMEREHGLGLDVMRRMKRALDPFGIMNPGKAGLS